MPCMCLCFRFGLSIPAGAMCGGVAGLLVGSTAGGTAGGAGGFCLYKYRVGSLKELQNSWQPEEQNTPT